MAEKFSITKRLKSFKHAFNGFKILVIEEHNSRVHIFMAIVVIAFGFLYSISSYEWLAIILSIGFVITTEILNSAIENICNFISP